MPAVLVPCSVCHEPAYNRAREGDAPWAAMPGEPGGVVCSPLCLLRARVAAADVLPDPLARLQRVDAVREALLDDLAVVEAVRLTVVHEHDRVPTFRGVLEGPVLEVDGDGVTLEAGPEGDALNVPWRSVVDAREAS